MYLSKVTQLANDTDKMPAKTPWVTPCTLLFFQSPEVLCVHTDRSWPLLGPPHCLRLVYFSRLYQTGCRIFASYLCDYEPGGPLVTRASELQQLRSLPKELICSGPLIALESSFFCDFFLTYQSFRFYLFTLSGLIILSVTRSIPLPDHRLRCRTCYASITRKTKTELMVFLLCW